MPKSIHVELVTRQSSKWPERPCGDVVACRRTLAGTLLVVGDGIGSGIRAHIAAEIGVRRIMELFRLGFSQHKAARAVAESMNRYRAPDRPYVAFSIAWIRADGMATILSYEAPPPLIIGDQHAELSTVRNVPVHCGTIGESNCYLRPGNALVLMSDGITQAGLGTHFPYGWGSDGVARFTNDCLSEGYPIAGLPERIHRQARDYWVEGGDDCTVAMARVRRGRTVTLLTGPPEDRLMDGRLVRRFLRRPGTKVICGGSTAEMVAREMGHEIKMDDRTKSLVAPPGYQIDGIDLVTEGAVTLNQVYRILDSNPDDFPEASSVFELCRLLQQADRIEIIRGDAKNQATGHIYFRQKGVLSRNEIIPLLIERLQSQEKLVYVTEATDLIRR